ncbi:hypothetical protein ACLOAU_21645 [Niabella sp. CJ426]|uniref:hypothetical protein n=1 Tax=Niabella sp. CJ426 TaxID=3393740 RepID=UPI003CFCF2AA
MDEWSSGRGEEYVRVEIATRSNCNIMKKQVFNLIAEYLFHKAFDCATGKLG